jgi:hypothetical protein
MKDIFDYPEKKWNANFKGVSIKGVRAVVGIDAKKGCGSFAYFKATERAKAMSWVRESIATQQPYIKGKMQFKLIDVELHKCKWCKELILIDEFECLKCEKIRDNAREDARAESKEPYLDYNDLD